MQSDRKIAEGPLLNKRCRCLFVAQLCLTAEVAAFAFMARGAAHRSKTQARSHTHTHTQAGRTDTHAHTHTLAALCASSQISHQHTHTSRCATLKSTHTHIHTHTHTHKCHLVCLGWFVLADTRSVWFECTLSSPLFSFFPLPPSTHVFSCSFFLFSLLLQSFNRAIHFPPACLYRVTLCPRSPG